jgi:hypothetical protein
VGDLVLKYLAGGYQAIEKHLPQYGRRDANGSITPHSSVAGKISLLKRSSRNCKSITA